MFLMIQKIHKMILIIQTKYNLTLKMSNSFSQSDYYNKVNTNRLLNENERASLKQQYIEKIDPTIEKYSIDISKINSLFDGEKLLINLEHKKVNFLCITYGLLHKKH